MKLLAAVFLLTFIAVTVGLECYTCTDGAGGSTDTSACDDPFNPATTSTNVLKLTCTSGYDVCAKAKVSSGGQSLVARTCYASSACPSQNGCASGSYGGASATVCCCTGNLCNGAGSVTVNIVTTVAVIVMAMIFTL